MDEDNIYNELVRRDKEAQEEQLGDKECENEAEGEESPVKFRRNPSGAPSKKERDEHEATHIPFRDLCTACVMGRGRRHPHRHRALDQEDREKEDRLWAWTIFHERQRVLSLVYENNHQAGKV